MTFSVAVSSLVISNFLTHIDIVVYSELVFQMSLVVLFCYCCFRIYSFYMLRIAACRILGLCNNFAYVIMLSAAHDILMPASHVRAQFFLSCYLSLLI